MAHILIMAAALFAVAFHPAPAPLPVPDPFFQEIPPGGGGSSGTLCNQLHAELGALQLEQGQLQAEQAGLQLSITALAGQIAGKQAEIDAQLELYAFAVALYGEESGQAELAWDVLQLMLADLIQLEAQMDQYETRLAAIAARLASIAAQIQAILAELAAAGC